MHSWRCTVCFTAASLTAWLFLGWGWAGLYKCLRKTGSSWHCCVLLSLLSKSCWAVVRMLMVLYTGLQLRGTTLCCTHQCMHGLRLHSTAWQCMSCCRHILHCSCCPCRYLLRLVPLVCEHHELECRMSAVCQCRLPICLAQVQTSFPSMAEFSLPGITWMTSLSQQTTHLAGPGMQLISAHCWHTACCAAARWHLSLCRQIEILWLPLPVVTAPCCATQSMPGPSCRYWNTCFGCCSYGY